MITSLLVPLCWTAVTSASYDVSGMCQGLISVLRCLWIQGDPPHLWHPLHPTCPA
jgi:hypothetical protein